MHDAYISRKNVILFIFQTSRHNTQYDKDMINILNSKSITRSVGALRYRRKYLVNELKGPRVSPLVN